MVQDHQEHSTAATAFLPAIPNQKEKHLANLIRAMRELQSALTAMVRAEFFCAHAGFDEVGKNLRQMAAGIKHIRGYLDTVYKKSPVSYNLIKMYANLETVVEPDGEKDEVL